MSPRFVASALVLTLAASMTPARASERVRVLVPDEGNLQYASFWVAKAGGHFAREGIDVDVVVPPGPQQTVAFFSKPDVDAAVLPPPMFLTLVAAKEPVVLVANLLRHDPIDLV